MNSKNNATVSTSSRIVLSKKKKFLFMGIGLSFFIFGIELLWRGIGFKARPELPALEGTKRLMGKPLHPGVCYSLVPNLSEFHLNIPVQINALGFRDIPRSENKPEKVSRILALGDSMVFGQGIPQESVFTRVLENKLGPEFEVWNTGHFAYNTQEEYFFLKHRGLSFQPDIVLLGYCMNNDTVSCEEAEENYQKVKESKQSKWIQFRLELEKRSAFVHWFSQILERRFTHKEQIDFFHQLYDDPHWNESSPYLRKIYELCQIRKIPFYLLIFPITYGEERPQYFQHYEFSSLHQKLTQLFQESPDLSIIDLLPILAEYQTQHPNTPLLVPYDGHPNETYHQLIAEVLYARLKKTF